MKTQGRYGFRAFLEGTVTLYRGDPTKYKTHSLSKGDINALFGQGIYLTSNKRIAGDYTVKGDKDTLFRGAGYKTKQNLIDAYVRANAPNFDEDGKSTFYQTALPSSAPKKVRKGVRTQEGACQAYPSTIGAFSHQGLFSAA